MRAAPQPAAVSVGLHGSWDPRGSRPRWCEHRPRPPQFAPAGTMRLRRTEPIRPRSRSPTPISAADVHHGEQGPPATPRRPRRQRQPASTRQQASSHRTFGPQAVTAARRQPSQVWSARSTRSGRCWTGPNGTHEARSPNGDKARQHPAARAGTRFRRGLCRRLRSSSDDHAAQKHDPLLRSSGRLRVLLRESAPTRSTLYGFQSWTAPGTPPRSATSVHR